MQLIGLEGNLIQQCIRNQKQEEATRVNAIVSSLTIVPFKGFTKPSAFRVEYDNYEKGISCWDL